MLLTGRTAVVTGAGSGIGREIALRFAAEGARIAVLDVAEAAAAVVEELVAAGAREPLLASVDVRSPTAVDEAIERVAGATERIDILVNCAGVREIGDVYTMPAEEWENVISINLSGTFYCCQSVARRMRESGGGSIVNLASVGGLIGLSHRPAYSAAKHGIVGLTKSLARDLAPAGIRVNALCPGVIRTPMTEQYFSDESFEQELAVSVPLARYGEASDVAQAALYLASDMAAYVTGVALPVDGGWLAEKSFVSGSGGASFLAGRDTRSASRIASRRRGQERGRAMGQAIGQMLTMAVGVALSPIPIIASVLLVSSPRGRVNGPAFVLGCAASAAVIGGVLIAVGVGSGTDDSGGPSTGTSTLKLVLGVVLLGMAARQWRGRPADDEDPPMPKWMGALDGFSPAKSLVAGVVVTGLNPKNLLLVIAGAAAVAGAGATAGEEAVAWAIFTLIAIVGVATPVVISFAMGDRSEELLRRLRKWMAHNNGVIMAVILLLIGVKLLGDGIAGL